MTPQKMAMIRDVLNLIRQIPPGQWRRTEKMAIKYGVGNCGEMRDAGFAYAEGIVPVARMSIAGGDHAFLVVGRGEDAVVCDPWTNAYYPKYLAERYMRNYLRVSGKARHTAIERFDPSRHAMVDRGV